MFNPGMMSRRPQNRVPAAASPPTATFVTAVASSQTGNQFKATAAALGTASSTRRIYVIVTSGLAQGDPATASIGGVSCDYVSTAQAAATGNDNFWVISA